MNFAANVAVNRLENVGRFAADVTIKCAECGLPFQFLGLEPGVKMDGAAVSVDGLEGRFAIAPKGKVLTPMQVLGFTIKGRA